MAEGGQLPWKRQVIDTSRGPAGSYGAVHKSLPDLPDGVAWQKNPTTREWSLVRIDQQQERDKQQYKLERSIAWNPHTGREQLTVKPVLKTIADVVATKETATISTSEEDSPPVPVLGKDYVVHTILPSDTFSGICLRYKVKPVTLRRVNQFSGTNLALAPSKLLIPLENNGLDLATLKLQDTSSPEYKMQLILNEFPRLAAVERKAYLEMNDWDVEKTLQEIRQDTAWESQQVFVAVPCQEKERQPLELETRKEEMVALLS